MYRKIESINEILEKAYLKTGKRKKKHIENVSLSQRPWGAVHLEALALIQNILRQGVKLAFLKNDKIICVPTNASEESWAGIVMETDEY